MLTYHLQPHGSIPLYEQLYRALRADIMSGTLAGGEKLPGKRRFAAHLRVSQTTVETAYSQLLAEGYILSKPRCGYFVEHCLSAPQRPASPRPVSVPVGQKAAASEPAFRFDFRTNIVDTGCFPFPTWARLSRNILSGNAGRLLHAAEPNGVPALREEIRRYLYDFRGLDVPAAQIILGAGSEYLITFIIQLLGRERVYALENPGYRKLYQIFARSDATVCPVSLDQNGLRVDTLTQSNAEIVYLTPSHHFPLGTVMPVVRRLEMLRWAAAGPERYIIEDDYDSEFRYNTRPIPALSGLDHAGRVIYVNTFAKSLAPSFRIGYVVLPDALMARYQERFSLYSSTVPALEQYTLAEFMRSGGFERHISRSRQVYLSRRDALLNALKQELSGVSYTVSGEEAGLHILLSVHNGMDEQTLMEKAGQYGVRVYGLSGYYCPPATPPRATLVLGYAGLTEDQIAVAVRLLGAAWRGENVSSPDGRSFP